MTIGSIIFNLEAHMSMSLAHFLKSKLTTLKKRSID
jgi:hypothetical protein